jgi:uncharacterized delta-60 repeat protein
MVRTALRWFILAVVIATATSAAAQQPFDLDVSFRTNIDRVYVNSIRIMPDGKLLVSGDITFANGDWRPLTRLDQDGSVDGSFPLIWAGGGKLVNWNDRYYVNMGGFVGSPSRLLPNGSLDPSFEIAQGGLFFTTQGGDFHTYPDGSVVITGSHVLNVPDSGWVGNHHMIWFHNDGTLDLSRQPRKGNGPIYLIVPQPDGKFLLSGAATTWEGVPKPNIFRVHADGTLDTSFTCAMGWGEAQGITVLADGRLIISGLMKTEFSSPDTVHLVRLFPDGSLDPSFNNDLILRNEDYGQFLFLRHTHLPGYGIALHGNYDEVEGHSRNGFMVLDENGFLPSVPLGGVGCGPYFDTTSGISRKGTTGMLTAPDGSFYIWGAYHGYDDGTTNDPTQRMVSRLYGLNVGMGERPFVPLRIQPNPTHGPLSVTIPEAFRAHQAEVLDTHGRLVWSMAMGTHEGQVQLDPGAIPSGAYVLRLLDRNGMVRHGRFMIMR